MIAAFLLGLVVGVVGVIGGLVYALATLQRHIRKRALDLQAEDRLANVDTMAEANRISAPQDVKRHALMSRRQLIAQLTRLDPVKVISKVKFCCADANGVGVSRYGRMVVVGSTLTLYEAVLTHKQTGQVRPYFALDTNDDPDLDVEDCSSSGDHKGKSVKSTPHGRFQSAPLSAPAGYTIGERVVGKVNLSVVSAVCEDRKCKSFSLDAMTGRNLVHLVRLSYEEELLAAGPDGTTEANPSPAPHQPNASVPFVAVPKSLGGVGWGSGGPKTADAIAIKEARDAFFTSLTKRIVRETEGKSLDCESTASASGGSSGHKRVFSDSDCATIVSSETHILQKATRPPIFIPNSTRPETKKGLQTLHGRDVFTAAYLEENPSQWRSLLVRFPNARETERWMGVFSPSHHSYQWRRFVKSLPSTDVLNVFVARIFFENREEAELQRILTKKINKKLSEVDLPRSLTGSKIRVHSVSPGPELPLISNVSSLSYNSSGEMGFDFDLWYRGGFILQLTLDLKVLNTTELPSLVVTIGLKEVKGRLHVSVSPPPANKMWLGFHEPPDVSIDFRQELAEASKSPVLQMALKLIPDLSVLITDLVKVELFEDMTLPNLDDFPLPNVEEDTPPGTPRTSTSAPLESPTSSCMSPGVSGSSVLNSSANATFRSSDRMSVPTPSSAVQSTSTSTSPGNVSASTAAFPTNPSKAKMVPADELHSRNRHATASATGSGGSSASLGKGGGAPASTSTKQETPEGKYAQPQW